MNKKEMIAEIERLTSIVPKSVLSGDAMMAARWVKSAKKARAACKSSKTTEARLHEFIQQLSLP